MKKLLLLPLLFLISCNSGDEPQQDVNTDGLDEQLSTNGDPAVFWDWFESKSEEFYHLEDNMDELFDELTTELHAYNSRLTFVFSTVLEDGKREMIISADGSKSDFPAVEKLIDAAPELDKWTFIGFRPRMEGSFAVNYDGLELDPKNMKFTHYADGDLCGIEVFIKDYDESDDRFGGAFFVLMDNALGEYDTETKIGGIELFAYPEDTTDLLPFTDIAAVVDSYFED